MARRFEKETAQTSEKEQQSHRNSAECTSVSSRLHQKTQIFKNHVCGHFRDPSFLLLATKRVGKPGVLLRKDFFSELPLMKRAFLLRERKDREDWSTQIWAPSSHAREDAAVLGNPTLGHICSHFVFMSPSACLTHSHTHIMRSFLILSCFILLGLAHWFLMCLSLMKWGSGDNLVPSPARISDGVCSGGPVVRNQPW